MRRTMESVAAERLNKIGIRDHNIANNGSASDNEATSVSQDAQDVSAYVSALAHQQSEDESSASEEQYGPRRRSNVSGSNGGPKTTSHPSLHHLLAKDLHQVGAMIIQTTSLLPRPRSESCFSTMESEQGGDQGGDHASMMPHKRSPKKEMAVNMLNLPLKPIKRKRHSSIHKSSEHAISPPAQSASAAFASGNCGVSVDSATNEQGYQKDHPKSPFLSLKTPPAVLCQPSHSLYPGTKKPKKGVTVTTPQSHVPPPPRPGTLPGYYLPPSRNHHTPATTPTTSPPSGTHHHSSHKNDSDHKNK